MKKLRFGAALHFLIAIGLELETDTDKFKKNTEGT